MVCCCRYENYFLFVYLFHFSSRCFVFIVIIMVLCLRWHPPPPHHPSHRGLRESLREKLARPPSARTAAAAVAAATAAARARAALFLRGRADRGVCASHNPARPGHAFRTVEPRANRRAHFRLVPAQVPSSNLSIGGPAPQPAAVRDELSTRRVPPSEELINRAARRHRSPFLFQSRVRTLVLHIPSLPVRDTYSSESCTISSVARRQRRSALSLSLRVCSATTSWPHMLVSFSFTFLVPVEFRFQIIVCCQRNCPHHNIPPGVHVFFKLNAFEFDRQVVAYSGSR